MHNVLENIASIAPNEPVTSNHVTALAKQIDEIKQSINVLVNCAKISNESMNTVVDTIIEGFKADLVIANSVAQIEDKFSMPKSCLKLSPLLVCFRVL